VSLSDGLPQPLTTQLGLGNRSQLPAEISTGCNSQDPAALLGPIALPDQYRYHLELPFGRTLPSSKRAEAFLVISSSTSSSRIRFLACASSTRSTVGRPGRYPRSTRS